mmetsp:Transcript_80123/g.159891  ORF Transcript_80123/g.159891 Transcript_80123/m.159891 type:complete len:260 (+) Transcript_80123:4407-5186(+)
MRFALRFSLASDAKLRFSAFPEEEVEPPPPPPPPGACCRFTTMEEEELEEGPLLWVVCCSSFAFPANQNARSLVTSSRVAGSSCSASTSSNPSPSSPAHSPSTMSSSGSLAPPASASSLAPAALLNRARSKVRAWMTQKIHLAMTASVVVSGSRLLGRSTRKRLHHSITARSRAPCSLAPKWVLSTRTASSSVAHSRSMASSTASHTTPITPASSASTPWSVSTSAAATPARAPAPLPDTAFLFFRGPPCSLEPGAKGL